MVSADTIKTFRIWDEDSAQMINVDMSIKDYMNYKALDRIAQALRSLAQ